MNVCEIMYNMHVRVHLHLTTYGDVLVHNGCAVSRVHCPYADGICVYAE